MDEIRNRFFSYSNQIIFNMRISYFPVFIMLLLVASCCKEEQSSFQTDGEGVIISLPFKWKYSLLTSEQNHNNSYFDSPIIYNSHIALPTTRIDGINSITMVNAVTGKKEWEWSDVFEQSYGADLDIYWFVNCENLFTWHVGSRSYCVNLANGATQWKIQREKWFDSRLGSYCQSYSYYSFSKITRPDGYDEQVVYKGNINTGELNEFLRANYSLEYIGQSTDNGLVGAIIYVNQIINFEDLLLVTYAEPLPDWKVRMMFALYNTDTEEWVYERKQLVEPHWNAGVQNTPIIYNERVYAAAGNSIVCHDVMTGDQLWRRNFEQDFLFSGFIIEDGMLLANCEDTYTYRLNPHSGTTIWRTKGAGTCSRMSYLNGVVYFVGGSTGFLHALDAETGQVLWRIDPRKLGEPNGNFTTNAVYCIPGEGGDRGRVVALTGRYAYCFEAAR